MKLSDVEIIPGTIIESEDPLFLGRIKCAAPGLFDESTMDKEIIPWIYPWFMIRYQSFSKLLKGCKVWIIRNNANKNEYWYLPLFEYIDASRQFISENYANDPELVICRDNGGSVAQYKYDDVNGFLEKIGDDNYIHLHPSKKIELFAKDTHVKIEGSKVYNGNVNEKYEPAVMGNKLKDLLCNLQQAIIGLKEAASSTPYTQNLQSSLQKMADTLDDAHNILANNVVIN